MIRELLWVQLAFDVTMLLALLALERSTARRRRGRRAAPAADVPAGFVLPADRGGRPELAAEAGLRRRLARFIGAAR
ncbi:MAG: hypothetical protein MUC67_03950 [Acidobacteria bacterium]|nr:hypothetical protein [Acidobacteriota bacterium]MCU0255004.1 hypothetical protein [Acidobacteriota bacterium]